MNHKLYPKHVQSSHLCHTLARPCTRNHLHSQATRCWLLLLKSFTGCNEAHWRALLKKHLFRFAFEGCHRVEWITCQPKQVQSTPFSLHIGLPLQTEPSPASHCWPPWQWNDHTSYSISCSSTFSVFLCLFHNLKLLSVYYYLREVLACGAADVLS